MYGLDPHLDGHAGGVLHIPSNLGPEYVLNDAHELSVYNHAQGGSSGSTVSASSGQGSPSSTLVGPQNGLQINLIWDASVKGASNWSAIEAAVVSAAQVYTTSFSNHVTINIAVGLGEVAGSAMSSNALGQSMSKGYLVGFSSLTHALGTADAALVTSGQISANAITAASSLASANFFVTSAQAKAIGLASANSTAIDGSIGLTQSPSALYFAANGGAIKSSQYDAIGVAAHEISEVLGRIGLEGSALNASTHAYTALDLFRYTSAHVADLSPSAGYFSTNLGVTNLANYNDPENGGDAADLASGTPTNAFNAFGTPGVITQVTATDLLQLAVLGYHVAGTGKLTTINA